MRTFNITIPTTVVVKNSVLESVTIGGHVFVVEYALSDKRVDGSWLLERLLRRLIRQYNEKYSNEKIDSEQYGFSHNFRDKKGYYYMESAEASISDVTDLCKLLAFFETNYCVIEEWDSDDVEITSSKIQEVKIITKGNNTTLKYTFKE